MAALIGNYALPVLLAVIGVLLLCKDKEVFEKFLEGAKDGLNTCVSVLPTMILVTVGVRMFSASGALGFFCGLFGTCVEKAGIPRDLLPLLILRPLSGSAATAAAKELFESVGPDSFAGRAASILLGSTDTIVYTFGMYFGALGIGKTRYAFPCAVAVMLFCTFLSCFLTALFFGR